MKKAPKFIFVILVLILNLSIVIDSTTDRIVSLDYLFPAKRRRKIKRMRTISRFKLAFYLAVILLAVTAFTAGVFVIFYCLPSWDVNKMVSTLSSGGETLPGYMTICYISVQGAEKTFENHKVRLRYKESDKIFIIENKTVRMIKIPADDLTTLYYEIVRLGFNQTLSSGKVAQGFNLPRKFISKLKAAYEREKMKGLMQQAEDISEPKEMVQIEERGEELTLTIKAPVKLTIGNTAANKSILMVLLYHMSKIKDGKSLCSQQKIAQLFGHKNRQDVDNRAACYRKAGNSLEGVLAPYISRASLLTKEVKDYIFECWRKNIFFNPKQIRELVEKKFNISLSPYSIRKVAKAAGFYKFRKEVLRQFQRGNVQYKEKFLIADLLGKVKELINQPGELNRKAEIVEELIQYEKALPSEVRVLPEEKRPSSDCELLEKLLFSASGDTIQERVENIARILPKKEGNVIYLAPQSKVVRTGHILLEEKSIIRRIFMLLFYEVFGTSFNQVGWFFGCHKSNAYRQIIKFGKINFDSLPFLVKKFFSGILCIDEKWIKIYVLKVFLVSNRARALKLLLFARYHSP